MGIRDQEIARLEKYAQGLGLRVEYRQHRPGYPSAGIVSIDGISERLIMYMWQGKSKTQIILDFVHELAHHLSWINNNRQDEPALLEALIAENNRKESDLPLTKNVRKLIYICEKKDAEFRDQVVREVGIKLPQWKLDLEKAWDLWYYKRYYTTGIDPTDKERKQKLKELKRRFKNANS